MFKLQLASVLCFALSLCPDAAVAQPASFFFRNFLPTFAVDAPVLDWLGNRLEGTNYLVMLYWGLTPESMEPLPPAQPFLIGDRAGYFSDPQHQTRELPGVPGGVFVWVQVRAWDARLGPSYEAVTSRWIGGYGVSKQLYLKSGGCFQCLPGALYGLESFSLIPLTGVLVRSIRVQQNQVVVEWYGPMKRYQLQQTSALDQNWQDEGEPTTALSSTNTITDSARFFRVIGMME